MSKINKIDPIPIPIATNKVIVSSEVFSQIVSKTNELITAVNQLLDSNTTITKKVNSLQKQLDDTNATIKNLATAIGNLLGGNEE